MQNLVEILKQVPVGTKLWSNICGEVELAHVSVDGLIRVQRNDVKIYSLVFYKDGKYLPYGDGECTLWPSKDHRAWDDEAMRILGVEKKPETPFNLQPFDKVLVRDSCGDEEWRADFFSYRDDNLPLPYMCVSCIWRYCIPYNDETKHLLGTKQEPPEKYRLSL